MKVTLSWWRMSLPVCFVAAWVAQGWKCAPAEAFWDWLCPWHAGRAPQVTYCAPVASYAPVAAAPACAPYVPPTIVSYAPPPTYYRSALLRVPVTYYRPISGVDPATGAPVTWMRPCSSYQWRVRRVPYFTFRPVMSVAGLFPVAAPACGGCWAAPAPYYAPGSAVLQPTPATGIAPTQPGGLPAADVPPSLSPSGLQPVPAAVEPPTTSVPQSSVPGGGETPSGGDRQPASRLKPVPDPDAEKPDPGTLPQLLNPRDRTARRTVPATWQYAPIDWPSVAQPVPSRAAGATNPPRDHRWDDSGWKTVSPKAR